MPVIRELGTKDQEEAREVRAGTQGREPWGNTACWLTGAITCRVWFWNPDQRGEEKEERIVTSSAVGHMYRKVGTLVYIVSSREARLHSEILSQKQNHPTNHYPYQKERKAEVRQDVRA